MDHEALEHKGNRDRDAADVAKIADLPRERRELELERRVAVVIPLQLARDLTVEGLVAERRRPHHGISVADDRAAERLVRMEEVCTLLRLRIALHRRGLGRLLRLPVQNGLVDLDRSLADDAVCRDLVARLQKDVVAHDDLVNGDLRQHAAAVDLAFDERGLLLQFLKGVLVLVFGVRRNGCGEDDRECDAHGLVPRDLPHEGKDHVDAERDAEDLDDGIVEIPLELLPEPLARLLRERVRAVLLTRGAHCLL